MKYYVYILLFFSVVACKEDQTTLKATIETALVDAQQMKSVDYAQLNGRFDSLAYKAKGILRDNQDFAQRKLLEHGLREQITVLQQLQSSTEMRQKAIDNLQKLKQDVEAGKIGSAEATQLLEQIKKVLQNSNDLMVEQSAKFEAAYLETQQRMPQ